MARAYLYVRWRWWNRLDLERLSKELSQKYEVKMLPNFGYELELTLLKDERDAFLVKSDTLKVFLSPFRAVLLQKKPAPFTSKDLELRKRLLELYPHERPTFLPMQISSEPEFETIEEKK
ncbi:MAG TPA: hypothetical protein VMW03_08175 [Candidatus Krumholzibacteriaceae bacterium]|nr:hypothetical protein [Candidatus Krumholzibacteriaceae bacterium]